MKEANSSGNFVDILATVASGPKGFKIDIRFVYFNFTSIYFGKDDKRGSRGMDPASFFGTGDTLDAVDAGFQLKLVVDVKAAYLNDRVVNGRDFPADLISVASVHTQEIISPDFGLFAAGAGMDFQNGNVFINSNHKIPGKKLR